MGTEENQSNDYYVDGKYFHTGIDEDVQDDPILTNEYLNKGEKTQEKDPYENHPWLFDKSKIIMASVVSEIMAGRADNKEAQSCGLNISEISPVLEKVNIQIEQEYRKFLQKAKISDNISQTDKDALINPENVSVKMTPLIENIRIFIARYLVQICGGNAEKLNKISDVEKNVGRILEEGFNRYFKIYEVDIPLYDKVYEEFDNLREDENYPLEVYLGRDGVYAFLGRRAKDIAKMRKLGPEKRKKMKEAGEIFEIHPKYITYPRYFGTNIDREIRKEYLLQEGITKQANPIFYDTGFEGTIPNEIMFLMGFPSEESNKSIKMLSAKYPVHRIKGIPEDKRGDILDYIEENAKLEESAEGFVHNEKTGKIRHIAKPTSPEEQFFFMMIKQAITRHYWLQEHLRVEK